MSQTRPKSIYNAPRFKVKQYDWEVFLGPAAGDPANDFALYDLETGTTVTLADFRGRWTVLETGSSTCSMYSKNISGMKGLRAQYPDVDFLLIYVREAHPGERLGPHKNFEDKKQAATIPARKYREDRRILVDSYKGDFHRAYGAMPNIIYVIRPDQIVHYRSDWATVDGLKAALQNREKPYTDEHTDTQKLKASRGLLIALRTMWTGGFLALWDFVVALPELARRHKLVDDYYRKHGKFKQQPSNS